MTTWARLDEQLAAWVIKLVAEVKVSEQDATKLATTIAADVRFLSTEAKAAVRAASPISIDDRVQELLGFQGWMDETGRIKLSAFAGRVKVIAQNYICFVYLPESCFKILSKELPSGSVAKRCCKFLCGDRIRALRNAVAHANWTYRSDFKAIVYWARKGDDRTDPLLQFEVEQNELDFWQALSRCVAHVALSNLE
jgi:hypothetical protein